MQYPSYKGFMREYLFFRLSPYIYNFQLPLIKVDWISRGYQVVARNCVVFKLNQNVSIVCCCCRHWRRCRRLSYCIYLSRTTGSILFELGTKHFWVYFQKMSHAIYPGKIRTGYAKYYMSALLKLKNQTHYIFNLFARLNHVGHFVYENNFHLLKFTCDW